MERQIAVLAGAEKFAGPALLQIAFRDLKSVCRSHHGFNTLACVAHDVFWCDENTRRFLGAASDSAAKLVQLREAETVRMFNHHDSCVRDINANFNHGRGDEHLKVAAAESFHDVFFFFAWKPSMKKSDAQIWEHV